MPTNIIDGRAEQVRPSTWSTVGGGLGQLGQLLAAAYAAKESDGGGGAVTIPPPVDPNANLGPKAMPAPMDPNVLGNPSADLAKLTASAPPPGGNPFSTPGMDLKLGGNGGINNLFSQRFPSLFPQASRNLTQYGGL